MEPVSHDSIGERVTLTSGQTPILRGFSPGIGKAFVEHDQPVLRQVNDGTIIGYSTRVWVDAPGFREVRDRDGQGSEWPTSRRASSGRQEHQGHQEHGKPQGKQPP